MPRARGPGFPGVPDQPGFRLPLVNLALLVDPGRTPARAIQATPVIALDSPGSCCICCPVSGSQRIMLPPANSWPDIDRRAETRRPGRDGQPVLSRIVHPGPGPGCQRVRKTLEPWLNASSPQCSGPLQKEIQEMSRSSRGTLESKCSVLEGPDGNRSIAEVGGQVTLVIKCQARASTGVPEQLPIDLTRGNVPDHGCVAGRCRRPKTCRPH